MYNIEAMEGEKKLYPDCDCLIPKIKKMMRIIVIKSYHLSKKNLKTYGRNRHQEYFVSLCFFFFKYNLHSSETDNFISKYSDLPNCVMNI